MTAMGYLLTAFQAVPRVLAAGADIAAFVQKHVAITKSFGKGGPTKEQWDALNAEIAADRHRLHSDTD